MCFEAMLYGLNAVDSGFPTDRIGLNGPRKLQLFNDLLFLKCCKVHIVLLLHLLVDQSVTHEPSPVLSF